MDSEISCESEPECLMMLPTAAAAAAGADGADVDADAVVVELEPELDVVVVVLVCELEPVCVCVLACELVVLESLPVSSTFTLFTLANSSGSCRMPSSFFAICSDSVFVRVYRPRTVMVVFENCTFLCAAFRNDDISQ